MDIRFPVLLGIVLNAQTSVYAFGQDVCFEPIAGTTVNQIVNCIGVGELCRTSHLTPILQGLCRLAATGDSLSGLNGSTVVGGRSLVHTDATYVMAQLIGYTPWQAYEMAIYSEATDQSYYTPFDQNGNPLLSSDTIASCHEQWGSAMDNACLLTTPQVNGLSRFDADSGGMWLHLHARYSATICLTKMVVKADRTSILQFSKNHEEKTDSLKITEKNANLLIYQLALAA